MADKIKKRIALSFLVIFIFTGKTAFCLPSNFTVVEGSATAETPDANTLVITASDHSILNFDTFSIAANETVRFIQPSNTASLLGRVTGSQSSEIAGGFFSNGQVVFVNSSGIHFANTANVQTGSLIASTLDIQNANYIQNRFMFERQQNSNPASILNEANLFANDGGHVILLADQVQNKGTINARFGSVVLGAATKATVSFGTDGLINFVVDQGVDQKQDPDKALIENQGAIHSGKVIMNAKALNDTLDTVMKQTGLVEATQLVEKDGVLELVANGTIEVQGQLTAGQTQVDAKAIQITGTTTTQGETTFSATGDIQVHADVTTDSGNLSFLADSDLDGVGAFLQAQGTTIKTTTFGDITLQSSGESTLANIEAAGDLYIRKAGTSAVYTQYQDSTIKTAASLSIGSDVTLAAPTLSSPLSSTPSSPNVLIGDHTSLIQIGKNWNNQGLFIPGNSLVQLTGPAPASVLGNNHFYGFSVIEPEKTVTFESGKVQEFTGILTLKGASGKLLNIRSSESSTQAQISIFGSYTIDYINLQGMNNILNHGPPAAAAHSINSLNNDGFSFENLILTPAGYRNLSEIQMGDQVLAYDSLGNPVFNVVEGKQTSRGSVFYLINGQYEFFENQSLWMDGRVVHAFELEVGSTIYTDGYQPLQVTSLQRLEAPKDWTTLTISGDHSYMVDGLLLHNASRYWVGGGATVNWNATGNTNWGSASNTQDNASVPVSSDDVFFDGVGTGASDSTLSADITIRSLDMTGYANTLTHNSAITLSIGDATAGAGNVALKLAAGMTYTLGNPATSAIAFVSTSATQQTVTAAGKTLANISFNAASNGSWILSDALTVNTSNATITLTQGSLSTGNQAVNAYQLSVSGSSVRSLTLGSSSVTLANGDFGIAFNATTTTNLTFDAGTSTITLSGSTTTFRGGGLTFNNVIFSAVSTSGPNITGANTFANLTLTGSAVKTATSTWSANQTVTGTFTVNGNSAVNRILITSDTLGTARTITAANVSASNVDFRDITGAGAGSWNLSAITGNSGDAGGNSGITFTTGATQYWFSNTGNWSDATKWFLATNGGGGAGRVPLPQDDVVFDANSFSSGSQTVTLDMPRAGKSVNWTGATNTPAWAKTTATTVYGSVTMIAGMSNSGTTNFTMEGRGAFTWTSAGQTFTNPLIVSMVGGSLTNQDAIVTSNTFQQTRGTYDLNNFNATFSTFASNTTTTRVLTLGSGTLTITSFGSVFTVGASGLTLTATTGTIKFTSAVIADVTFAGGGKTYGNIWFSRGANTSTNTLSGSNTFTDFKDDGTAAHSILFTAGTTQTVSTFTVSGSSGNVITLNSTTTGTYTLSKSSGKVSSDYLNIQHAIATGGAVWFAGANSVDNQATVTAGSGWIFRAAPDRVITAAGGNWSSAATWVEGIVPTSSDNVGAYSGSGNLTIDAAASARSLDLTDYVGTLTHNSAITLSIGDATAGTGNVALKFVAGMTYTLGQAQTSAISFVSTSVTQQTVTTAGKTVGNVTFNGAGGNWILSDSLTSNAASLTFSKGTLNTNGQAISVGTFSSFNSNTRTLTLGASVITLNGSNPWFLITTGLTFNVNTSSFVLTGSSQTFAGSGLTYNDISFTGVGTPVVTGANTFANFTRTGTASKTGGLSLSADQIITGTLTINGNSATNRVLVTSDTIGTSRTLTAATVSVSNADFRDITGAGAGSWNLSAITGLSGDAGGNSGITFTTGATQYWQTTTTGSKTWSTAANWFLATNGGGGAGRVPLPQDDVVFDANSIGAASTTVTADMPRLGKSINWTGVTNSPTFAISSTANTIYGSLTLVSGMTLTTGQTTIFEGRNSYTLTTAGKTFGAITQQMFGGTLTLQDNLTVSSASTFTLNNGVFDANGQNFTTGFFDSSNSNVRTITMGAGTWTITASNGSNLWNTQTSTNLTLNRGNAVVLNGAGGNSGGYFGSSTTESKSVGFRVTAGVGTYRLLSSSGFYDVDLSAATVTFDMSNGGTFFGNLTIGSSVTVTGSSNTVSFRATSGTQTITSNGKTIDNSVTFDGVGGTFQLADDMTVGTTRTTTLTNGTLKLYDSGNTAHTLTTGLFSTTNSNTRSIDGPGTLALSSTGTIFTSATSTGLSFGGTKITIKTTDSSSTAKTISAGSVAGFPSLWISAGDNYTFTNITNVTNLDYTGFTGTSPQFPNTINGSLTLVSGMTMPAASGTAITFGAISGTKTITSGGKTIDRPLIFDGVGGTWQLADALTVGATRTVTVTNGTLTLAGSNIDAGTTLTVASGGTFKFRGSETITATTKTLNSGSTVNFTGDGDSALDTYVITNYFSGSYVNLTINSTDGATDIFQLGGALTVTGNLTITAGTLDTKSGNNYAINVAGNWSNSGTFTPQLGTVTFNGTASGKTITSGGSSFYDVSFTGSGGAWTLQDTFIAHALSTSSGTSLIQGTTIDISATSTVTFANSTFTKDTSTGKLKLLGDFNLSAGNNNLGHVVIGSSPDTVTLVTDMTATDLTVSSGDVLITDGYEITLTDYLTIAGTLTATSGTDGASTITLGGNWSNSGTFTSGASIVIFNGADQSITGATTFYDLTKSEASSNDSTNSTWTFPASTTTTVTHQWTVDGLDANDKILLVSSTPGTRWNINASGTPAIGYATVTDSNNTSGTLINEYSDSTVTDGGHNLNWAFSSNSAFTWLGVSSATWSTNANWLGGAAPGVGDTAVFNFVSSNNSTISSTVSVGGMSITADYSGTITQSGSNTLTVGSSNYSQAGGTFTGGSGAIAVNGTFALSGGAFTATSGTTTFGSGGTMFQQTGGTFTHNSGTVVFNQPYDNNVTITTTTDPFNNVTIQGAGGSSVLTMTLTSSMYVTNLTFGTMTFTPYSLNTGTIYVSGDISITGSPVYGGSATIVVNGIGTQAISSSAAAVLPNVTINKTLGTLNLSGSIYVGGNWTYTAGTLNAGTSTLIFAALFNTPIAASVGSESYNNVTFIGRGNAQITTVSGTMTVAGNAVFTSSGFNGRVNGGTLNVGGNLTLDTSGGSAMGQSGTLTITLNGTGTQTITQSSSVMPSGTFTIDKSSGTAVLAADFTVNSSGQDLTITQGTLDLHGFALTVNDVLTVGASGTLQLYGAETLTAGTKTLNTGSTVKFTGDGDSALDTYTITNYFSGSYKNLTINSTDGATDIFQLGTTLTVAGNLTNTAGTLDTKSGSNYAINLAGNWSNSGTFLAQQGTVTLNGTSQTISGSATFYNLTKTVSSADTLTFTAGTTQTIAAGGKLTLRGASGQLLTLASSTTSAFTIAFADTTAKYVVDYLSVSYSTASGLGIVALNSTNGGNNILWSFQTTSGTLRYWIATSTGNWNDTANWSTTSGGSGGSSVPVSTSDAIFDGNGNGSVTVNAAIDVKGLYLAGYSGTISQGSNTITVGADNYLQGSGVFTGSGTGSAVTLNGTFTLSGGTFTPTSGTISTASNWTYSGGTITQGIGTISFGLINNGSATITGSQTLNNVTFGANINGTTWIINSGDTLTVPGTLTMNGSFLTISTGTIAAQGHIFLNGGINGSGVLLINGTGDQTLTGAAFNGVTSAGLPNLNINKLSGTLTLSGSFYTYHNWTYTAGIVDPGTSSVEFAALNAASGTITGSQTLHNVTFSGNLNGTTWVINSGDTLTVNNTLTMSLGIGVLHITTGTLAVQGDIVETGVGAGSLDGNSPIILTGSNNQSISFADSNDGTFTVNKSGGTATLAAALSLNTAGQDLTITQGTLDLHGFALTVNDVLTVGASGTLQLYGNETITAGTKTLNTGSTVKFTGDGDSALDTYTITNYFSGSYKNLTINSTDGVTDIFQLGGTLTVAGNLTNTAGTLDTVSGQNYAINLAGNWSNSGTFTARLGTVTLNGTSQTISGSATFYNLTKTVSSADTLTFTAGTTQTIAAGGKLTLRGASGQLLTLASTTTSAFTIAFADTTAKYVVDYLSVSYSTASGLGIVALNSTNGGNNILWSFQTTSGTLRYWIATSTGNWNDTANWSTTSGGSGGSSVPVSTSDAIFDGNGNGSVTVNANINVKGLYLAGYSGTITQGSNTVTVGADNYLQGSGVFTGSGTGSAIAMNGNYGLSGGTFTSTSGNATFSSTGNMFIQTGGTFGANGGTVVFNQIYDTNTTTITTTTDAFNHVTFQGGGGASAGKNIVISSSMYVNGTLTIGTFTYPNAVLVTGTIYARGDISVAGANLSGGTATIVIDGTGTQTFSSSALSYLPSVTVNKSLGTLNLSGTIYVTRNWTYTAGTLNSGTSTLVFFTTFNTLPTITVGSEVYNNVTSDGYGNLQVTTLSGTMTVAGNLLLTGRGYTPKINGGAINVAGNLTSDNSGGGTFGGGTVAITLNGTGTQTITQSAGTLPSGTVTINKSSGTAVLATDLTANTAGQDLTITQGTLDLHGFALTVNDVLTVGASGTLQLYGNETLTAGTKTLNTGSTVKFTGDGDSALDTYTITNYFSGSYKNLTINSTDGVTDIFQLGGTLTVAGNLTNTAGTLDTVSGQNYAINLAGNWSNSGTFTARLGTVTLNGTSQTISGSTTFYNLIKTVSSADTLTFTAGTTQTIAAGGKLTLRGASSNLLTLASTTTSAFTIAFADTTSRYVVDYLSVSYSTASGLGIVALNSTNGGNNTLWSFQTTSGTLRYWVGTSTGNWNDTANWSTTSGGAGGSSVPVSTSDAIFDGNANGNTTVNAAIDVKGLYLAGYSGTITQGSNTITVGADNYLQGSGIFTGSGTGSAATINGDYGLSGGVFTSTSGNFDTSGFSFTGGTFNHNSGTVRFMHVAFIFNSSTITANSPLSLNNLVFYATDGSGGDGAHAYTISGTYNVAGNLTISQAGSMSGGIINVAGNIITSSTGLVVSGTTEFVMNGSGTQTINAGGQTGNFTKLTIGTASVNADASSSGTLTIGTFTLSNGAFTAPGGNLDIGNLSISGGTFTHNSGTVRFPHFPGLFSNSTTIDAGAASLNNVTFYSKDGNGTHVYTITGTVALGGNLTITEGGTINGGTITVAGNLSSTDTTVAGTTAIVLNGAGTQTLTFTGGGDLPNGTFTISKSSGTAVLATDATTAFNAAGQDLTITQGTLDLHGFALTVNDVLTVGGSGTLQLYGNETLTAGTKTLSAGSTVKFTGDGDSASDTYTVTNYFSGSYKNLTITSTDGTTDTFQSGAALTVAGAFTISANSLYDLNGNTLINTGGTFSNAGTLRLQGGETVTNFTNDTAQGTVTYNGTSTYATLKAGNNYYNLTFDGIAGSWTAASAMDINNNLTITNGTFVAPSTTLNIAGNWSNAGTFTANGGSVIFDGANQTITGANTFYDLSKVETNNNTNSTWTFPASTTTTVTHSWTVDGFDSDDKILMVSSTPGVRWNINASGTPAIDYATVTDSNNTSGTVINEYSDNTVSTGGHNLNWAFSTDNAFTWIGTTSATWSTNANWLGGAAPGSGNTAVFVGTISNNNATISSTVSVAGLSIDSDYTGTITQSGSNTLTVGSSNYSQAGGTFTGGTGTITINGTVTISGGTVNFGNQTVIANAGNGTTAWTYTAGTVNAGASTVQFGTGLGTTLTIDSGAMSFNNVILNNGNGGTGGLIITGTMDVNGNLTITNSVTISTGTIAVAGNVTTTDSDVSGSAIILLDGSGDHILSASGGTGAVPNISINTSGTVTIQDTIIIGSANGSTTWTYTAGTVNAGTSTVQFGVSGVGVNMTVSSGAMSFNNVVINNSAGGSGGLTITGTLDVNGNLTISNSATISGGTITVAGNVTTTDSDVSGTTIILLDGSGNHILSASGGTGAVPNISINTSGTVTIQDTIIIGSASGSTAWSYTAGTVNAGTSTVQFGVVNVGVNMTIDSGAMSFNNVIISNSLAGGGGLIITGTLDVNGNLTISNSASITGAITVAGNLTSTDTSVSGAATITLDGASTQTLTFTGGGDLPDGTFTISKSSGTAVLATDATVAFNAAGQDLTITSGTLDLHGFNLTVNDVLTVGASGTLQLYGNETITAGTKTLNSGSTVKFTGDGDSAQDTYTITNYFSGSYKNLILNSTDGATDIFQLGAALTVAEDFTLTAGTFNQSTSAMNLAGNLTIANGGVFTKSSNGSALTFNGTTAKIFTDSNSTKQNLGVVAITKTNGTASNNKITLASGMTVDTLTISANNTLDLASGGYILKLANSGATANVFTVSGTLTPGISTVQYAATNSGGNINVAAVPYNSLELSGSETYELAGNLTSGNAVTGNLTIDSGAILDASLGNNYGITLAGNWSDSGTFTPRNGTVTFNGSGQAISGDSTFYNLTKTVASADTLTFEAAKTQTVSGALTLQGASGNLLSLRSSSANTAWRVDPQGSKSISYVDAKDSNNINGTAILPHTSISSGNNTNWNFGYLAVTGTSPVNAGANDELTVTAYDAYDALNTPYTGSHTLTFSGLAAAPDASVSTIEGTNIGNSQSVAFTNGASNNTVLTLIAHKAESATLNVTDGTIGSSSGSHGLSLTVNPGALVSLAVSGIADPADTGVAYNVTVAAYDTYQNLKTNYSGTIHFSSTDASATLPTDYTFVGGDSGTHTFTGGVTFVSAGIHDVTVSDGATSGSQSGIAVNYVAPPSSGNINLSGAIAAIQQTFLRPIVVPMPMGEVIVPVVIVLPENQTMPAPVISLFINVAGSSILPPPFEENIFTGVRGQVFLPETIRFTGTQATPFIPAPVSFEAAQATPAFPGVFDLSIFNGVNSQPILPPTISFQGVGSNGILPSTLDFDSVGGDALFPRPLGFEAAQGAGKMPDAFDFRIFTGANLQTALPPLISFDGAQVRGILSEPVYFESASGEIALPRFLGFESIYGAAVIPGKVSFESPKGIEIMPMKSVLPAISFEHVTGQAALPPGTRRIENAFVELNLITRFTMTGGEPPFERINVESRMPVETIENSTMKKDEENLSDAIEAEVPGNKKNAVFRRGLVSR